MKKEWAWLAVICSGMFGIGWSAHGFLFAPREEKPPRALPKVQTVWLKGVKHRVGQELYRDDHWWKIVRVSSESTRGWFVDPGEDCEIELADHEAESHGRLMPRAEEEPVEGIVVSGPVVVQPEPLFVPFRLRRAHRLSR